jgi:hypothetical protein
MGGIFGSGLYPRNQTPDTAGNIIDAVTRGATTLIHGAYLRTQAEREQARQDEELKLRQREADRADRHDEWERQTHQDEQEYKRGQLERQDAQSGYTPAKREQTEEVVPGDVQSNGLFGAPPKVTAPTIKSAYRDIPASYDVTKSQPYAIEMAKEGERQHARDEHLADEKTMANYRENLRSKRPNRGATGDSPSVHAATQVRAQINEVDQRIKALTAEKKNLAPGTIKGDDVRAAAIDEKIKPLQQRADSLRSVHDNIASKLTDEAGIDRSVKPNGSTVRQPAAKAATAIETQDEYDHLHDVLKWPDAKIAQRYTVPKTIRRGK